MGRSREATVVMSKKATKKKKGCEHVKFKHKTQNNK